MASALCSSALNPGLLGQLMLATVAIHAARNSRGVSAMVLVFVMEGAGAAMGSTLTGIGSFALIVSVFGAMVTEGVGGVGLSGMVLVAAISSTFAFL